MGLQLSIIAFAFTVFGIIGWFAQGYSPAYVGLIVFGLIGILAGIVTMRAESRS